MNASAATNVPQENWQPAEAAQIEIGDYIRIDHRWFDHPFTRRMFRVTSERELAIMRSTNPTRMFVDRARAAQDEMPAVDDEGGLTAQRDALGAAQARDRVTLDRAQEMLALLGAGDASAAASMVGYTEYLVAILNNSTTPLAPIAPTAERRSPKRMALLGSDAVWLAATIGKRMGLDGNALRTLAQAAAAHVAGLMRMPPYLCEEEPGDGFMRDATFRSYPLLSAMILEQCGGFSDEVLRIVREHRERPDGSGFPHGLKGEQIHPLALILGAVRELQICCAGGTTSPAVALAGIYHRLRDCYGTQIANNLATTFLVVPVGTYVQLSDGSMARILQINEAARMSPVVESYGPNAAPQAPVTIDLSQQRDQFIVRAIDTSRLPPRLFEPPRKFATPAQPAETVTSSVPAVPQTLPEAGEVEQDEAARLRA